MDGLLSYMTGSQNKELVAWVIARANQLQEDESKSQFLEELEQLAKMILPEDQNPFIRPGQKPSITPQEPQNPFIRPIQTPITPAQQQPAQQQPADDDRPQTVEPLKKLYHQVRDLIPSASVVVMKKEDEWSITLTAKTPTSVNAVPLPYPPVTPAPDNYSSGTHSPTVVLEVQSSSLAVAMTNLLKDIEALKHTGVL